MYDSEVNQFFVLLHISWFCIFEIFDATLRFTINSKAYLLYLNPFLDNFSILYPLEMPENLRRNIIFLIIYNFLNMLSVLAVLIGNFMLAVVYPRLSLGTVFFTKQKSNDSWGSGGLGYGRLKPREKLSYSHSESFWNTQRCSLNW